MGQEDDMKKVLRPMREMLRQVRETTAVDTWQAIRRDVIAGFFGHGLVSSHEYLEQVCVVAEKETGGVYGPETTKLIRATVAKEAVDFADALIARLDKQKPAGDQEDAGG